MYVPSGLTRSHSSTSPSITGVCAAANLFGPSQRRLYAAAPSKLLNPEVTQSLVVLIRVRIVFQLIQGARMVHHIEIIEGAKYIHFALRLSRLSQHRWQQHSSLPIHLHRLAVIARPHQEFSLRFIRRWQLCQLVFNLRPNLHRINPCRLACRAGDVKLVPILLQGLQKHGGYLQPALLVHLRRTIPPQLHAPRLTRPRFGWDQARKSGLEGPKCPLSPQSLLLVLSVLPCCALPPATLFYCYPLLTTFAHMIDCICRLSRENMRFFKIFQKSCENLLQVSGDFCRDCLWFWIQTTSIVSGWVSPFRSARLLSPLFTLLCSCDTLCGISAARTFKGASTMEWVTPQHEEIDLNCEVSSYAN